MLSIVYQKFVGQLCDGLSSSTPKISDGEGAHSTDDVIDAFGVSFDVHRGVDHNWHTFALSIPGAKAWLC
jgi:hypothetical protein